MRRRFVHVDMSGEYAKLRIALLKSGIVFRKGFLRLFAYIGIRAGVVFVAYLDNDFVKRFFLMPGSDMLIVIRNDAITPLLFCVVPFKCVVEQFMINRFDRFITEIRIQMRTLRIGILCVEFPAVVVRRAFSYFDADRSL